MQWITVKCGDGGSAWTQFTSDLVNRAHNSGLKIFGWAYAYGNDVQGEINVAVNALNLGADGFIIDAEIEYETNANNTVSATQYCQGIRAAYPNRFLAHAPFPIISSHSRFPYVTFGKYCDAVMPQACFWSCQHHAAAPEKWTAIGAAAIGDFLTPPYIVSLSVNRSVDAGTNLVLSVTAAGAAPR